ncbi:MAG: hypothetical protein IID33_17740 [Planctomycetes bacterium]|nr:hypothetical protein [Planctomycetota bacterium]
MKNILSGLTPIGVSRYFSRTARLTVLQAAKGVGDGRIDVSPLVEKKCLACGTCDFRPVCRFDRAFNDPRDAATYLPSAARIGGDA